MTHLSEEAFAHYVDIQNLKRQQAPEDVAKPRRVPRLRRRLVHHRPDPPRRRRPAASLKTARNGQGVAHLKSA
ncbi:hypothetical protein JIX55_46240 [Streptomyces sp. DSM 40750]|nr:hypothetical protein [Streptomyces sp. DSM 40750]UUU28358.1 hypothetical protein JIX55_46240 [Streptomyces sp. DSM 40750]